LRNKKIVLKYRMAKGRVGGKPTKPTKPDKPIKRNEKPPPDAGNNKPTFGSSLGNIGLGAGLGLLGSELLGNDSSIGNALENVSEGVGDAIGDVGEGVGNVASGVGTGVGAVGQGVGSGVGSLSAGVGSGIGSVGAGLGSMAEYLPLALVGVGIFVVYNMTSQPRR
jgi:hypothetical protein